MSITFPVISSFIYASCIVSVSVHSIIPSVSVKIAKSLVSTTWRHRLITHLPFSLSLHPIYLLFSSCNLTSPHFTFSFSLRYNTRLPSLHSFDLSPSFPRLPSLVLPSLPHSPRWPPRVVGRVACNLSSSETRLKVFHCVLGPWRGDRRRGGRRGDGGRKWGGAGTWRGCEG